MNKKNLLMIILSISLLIGFAVFTLLIKIVDVGVAGESGVEVGFSTLNQKFFNACNYSAMIKKIRFDSQNPDENITASVKLLFD